MSEMYSSILYLFNLSQSIYITIGSLKYLRESSFTLSIHYPWIQQGHHNLAYVLHFWQMDIVKSMRAHAKMEEHVFPITPMRLIIHATALTDITDIHVKVSVGRSRPTFQHGLTILACCHNQDLTIHTLEVYMGAYWTPQCIYIPSFLWRCLKIFTKTYVGARPMLPPGTIIVYMYIILSIFYI